MKAIVKLKLLLMKCLLKLLRMNGVKKKTKKKQ